MNKGKEVEEMRINKKMCYNIKRLEVQKMNQKYKGILYILLSALCFAFMNTFVKLAGDLPSIQKSFFRNFVALIFAAVVLQRSGKSLNFTLNLWHNRYSMQFLCYRPIGFSRCIYAKQNVTFLCHSI